MLADAELGAQLLHPVRCHKTFKLDSLTTCDEAGRLSLLIVHPHAIATLTIHCAESSRRSTHLLSCIKLERGSRRRQKSFADKLHVDQLSASVDHAPIKLKL